MDATDHENIPSPDLEKLYSNLIHTGFDYLNQEKYSKMQNPSDQASSVIGSVHKDLSKDYAELSEKRKPFGWFYKGLFPEPTQKLPIDLNENKNSAQNSKHSPHKKYVLSNFDLNALSPNSW